MKPWEDGSMEPPSSGPSRLLRSERAGLAAWAPVSGVLGVLRIQCICKVCCSCSCIQILVIAARWRCRDMFI